MDDMRTAGDLSASNYIANLNDMLRKEGEFAFITLETENMLKKKRIEFADETASNALKTMENNVTLGRATKWQQLQLMTELLAKQGVYGYMSLDQEASIFAARGALIKEFGDVAKAAEDERLKALQDKQKAIDDQAKKEMDAAYTLYNTPVIQRAPSTPKSESRFTTKMEHGTANSPNSSKSTINTSINAASDTSSNPRNDSCCVW